MQPLTLHYMRATLLPLTNASSIITRIKSCFQFVRRHSAYMCQCFYRTQSVVLDTEFQVQMPESATSYLTSENDQIKMYGIHSHSVDAITKATNTAF